MSGRGRVDGQRTCIADIRDVVEELQRVDELLPGVPPTLQFEPYQATVAALQIGPGASCRGSVLEARIDDPGYGRVIGQVLRDLRRVLAMLAHAKRERLEALNELERIEWAHRCAVVAQESDTCLHNIGNWSERLHCFGPHCAMIARVGRIEHREPRGVTFPVEAPTIDDHSTDR